MAAAILRVYQAQFDTHPHATLAATNGGLSALADVVAQTTQMIVSCSLINQNATRSKFAYRHAVACFFLFSTIRHS